MTMTRSEKRRMAMGGRLGAKGAGTASWACTLHGGCQRTNANVNLITQQMESTW